MTGRVIDASEAERYGILNRICGPGRLRGRARRVHRRTRVGPTHTYAAWKLSVNRSVLLELDAYTDYERWLNLMLRDSEDTKEGVASFREKRSPNFTGR